MLRKLIFSALFVMAAGVAALANDSSMQGKGGTMRPMQGEHAAVRMVREWVRMDVYPGYSAVEATFVFQNNGPATTVKMGFPEFNWRETMDNTEPALENFRSWVDGKVVNTQRVPDEGSSHTMAYWVKDVPFEANQTRRVRVEYKSKGGSTNAGKTCAVYDFTGANWAGDVAQSDLLAVLHLPGAHLVSSNTKMKHKDNRMSFRKTNWEADEPVYVCHTATHSGGLMLAGMEISPYESSEFPFVYESKGKASVPFWMPHVIVRNKKMFINFDVLGQFLEANDLGRVQQVLDELEPARGGGVLELSNNTALSFSPGHKGAVNRNNDVTPLSAEPFTLNFAYDDQATTLYVPLDSIEKIFNLKSSLDRAAGIVMLKVK